ncbi:MAG: hypothetical protein JO044_13380 [Mycobacteriaceae bacterium]|nr:hypothetical protein [Mycobacteriaceae bacterium]MBV9639969.1 hypothetical protein [Mycobacteriaceae bacterium]
MRTWAVVSLLAVALLTGCSTLIGGTASWPGAKLEKVVLKADDFPPGVDYARIIEQPSQPDNAGGPSSMLSKPEGCSNGLTDVIAATAERGPGSATKYSVAYDGARLVMSVLSWKLDLDRLAATASRCEHFDAYFDPTSEGIPITTTKLVPSRPGQLVYQQTMRLHDQQDSVFMSFENIDRMAVFGIAFPTKQLGATQVGAPKATLPQTFLDVVTEQADRMLAS